MQPIARSESREAQGPGNKKAYCSSIVCVFALWLVVANKKKGARSERKEKNQVPNRGKRKLQDFSETVKVLSK